MTNRQITTRHNGGPPIDDQGIGEGGWVAVARRMRFHPLVGCGKPVKPCDPERGGAWSRYEAWQDLIMECRYKPGSVINKGRKMEIRPGQLLGAISWLAHRWNWTPKTVRWFLDRLEEEGMAQWPEEVQAEILRRQDKSESGEQAGKRQGKFNGNQVKVLTICNYSLYQLGERSEGQPTGQAEGQAPGQASGNRTASQGQHLNKGTQEQNTQGTREPNADELARQAYEDGQRIKGGAVPKSARAEARCRGELDGSKGITFSPDGKLSIANGAAAALAKEYPGVDLAAVCDKAAPEVARYNYPNFMDAMATLRKWARIESQKPASGKPAQSDKARLDSLRRLV